ncbi:MAG: hypothetical protein F6K18_32100 [Okeania sp. SIO2C2]|uniref:hypothetical protein n=1 Tax=Okeania sp. SIO2C2 TaxID=2607787 RepID=UPI0013B86175|nr:hypothetical protein [Okeania sp. SIO2C2]NEP91085.1 hypothetical protein [Okeania sp. SIO2C2]
MSTHCYIARAQFGALRSANTIRPYRWQGLFIVTLRKIYGEMGEWGDGEMGGWGDGEMGRWGDGEICIFA